METHIPAPRLKDVALSSPEWETVYRECIALIRDMYQKARLVHADFSEYNLVYHNSRVYVIDVGQSMDIYQENSNTFLMMDICNCNEFFEKKGVVVDHEVELFEDITGLRMPEYLKVDGRLNRECFVPTRIIEVANKEDVGLFIENYKDARDRGRAETDASGGSPDRCRCRRADL
ncbi:atypical/RIO/RIO1 protein kinase [Vittaforma corneae ATCC 50505]|uniref:non-specific serine/threonine protein kinase n=1 Tax=Vittaforma corneae (strain ATCC 50505) TaxID=993615 RepID=L2GM18_VITCO|nr:atypical/RIO/RIO1 protein kinase [Vittaforma corneae ATCC 50505]ELA41342.1 atypical/RIO/RIO1 protein kinase [Vittaforma corneae ATCC 50505]